MTKEEERYQVKTAESYTVDSTADIEIHTTLFKLNSIIEEFLKKFKKWEFPLTMFVSLTIALFTTNFEDILLNNEIIVSHIFLDIILGFGVLFFLYETILSLVRIRKYNCKSLVKEIKDKGTEL